MGPRIFIRGYTRLGREDEDEVLLQWGRGFSSADTHGQRMRGVRPAASMGPRIFIRGYAATPEIISGAS